MGRGGTCLPEGGTNIPGLGIYISGKVIVLLFTIAACLAITGVTLTAVGFAQTRNTPFSINDETENFYTRHMVYVTGNSMTIAGPILIIVGVLSTILFGALWMMNSDTSKRIFEERHYAPPASYHTADSEEMKSLRPRRGGDDMENFDREPKNGAPPYKPPTAYDDDSSTEHGSKSDRGVGKMTGV